MPDESFILDSALLKQILVDFILPLAVAYITTYLVIKTQQKSNQFEKNQYLRLKYDVIIYLVFF